MLKISRIDWRLFTLITLFASLVRAQPALEPPNEAAPDQAVPEPAPPPEAPAPKPPDPPAEEPSAAPLPAATPNPANAVPPPAPNVAEAPPAARKFEGFKIASDDGEHELRFRALIHADARFLLEGQGTDTFLLRRARPMLEAKLFRHYELRLQPEFAGASVTLLDAFGNLHFVDEVQLRLGKGKSPVGLERLQSPADIPFAERGFPTLLVPNRDVGVQLHGLLLEGAVEYAVGVYNGVPDGASGNLDGNNEKDLAGRVFLLPFKGTGIGPLKGFGVGFSATHGTQSGALPEHRSSAQEIFFAYLDTASANGPRTLISPQGYYYFGPLGLSGEFVQSKQRVTDGTTNADVTSRAWLLGASVTLGGEPSYKGMQVRAPLDPERGGFGAFELSARYHELSISRSAFDNGFADPASSARRARAWTIGLTWWFAARLRALLNYEQTRFSAGAPAGSRETEALLVTRLQVAF